MKRSPIKRRGRTKHQLANVEHREYLAWIHQQPCAACGTRQNIQAAHVGRGGVGMKHGSDAEVIPLCGPRAITDEHCVSVMYAGCHHYHDHRSEAGSMFDPRLWTRADVRAWDAHQVAVHRGRFEARNVGTFEKVPF